MNKFYFIIVILVASCQTDGNINNLETESLKLSVPDYFPAYNDDLFNPMTNEGIELGKILFFDKRLSENNKVSCATCHMPQLNFSDGKDLSNLGVTKTHLNRTTPVLVNLLWNTNGLFWDGGATNLESQALAPLTNKDEMGQDLDELLEELNNEDNYPKKFKAAFDDEISVSNILKALAQFQRSLISSNAKYDKILKKNTTISFTEEEQKGYDLFKINCNSCHKEPLFTDNSYHNNGLDDTFEDASFEELFKGRYRVTNNISDIGKYRTPTLRNIMHSAPYMHDGRLKTIDEVLNHYCCNIKNSATLDEKLKNNSGVGLSLSAEDKYNIIKFLHTLTDEDFLKTQY